jgi:hypothetical protein
MRAPGHPNRKHSLEGLSQMSTETAARTVYVTASPDHRPYDYKGRHRRTWQRSRAFAAAAFALVGITAVK